MPALSVVRRCLIAATLILLVALVAVAIDAIITGTDLAVVGMALAVVLSTMTTLTLSFEALSVARQSELGRNKEHLSYLKNLFESAKLLIDLSRGIVGRLHDRPAAGDGIDANLERVRRAIGDLSNLWCRFYESDRLALLPAALISVTENQLRTFTVADDLAAIPAAGSIDGAAREALDRAVRALDHMDHDVKHVSGRIDAMLAAPSVEAFRALMGGPGDRAEPAASSAGRQDHG